jgi:outer membrane lipoprotein SlyB
MNKFTKITIAVVAVLSLGACASNRGYQQPQYQTQSNYNQQGVRFGTVQNITVINSGSQTSGGGALIGALVGGVIGNRFGGGTGKDLSTVGGAFGGAIIGNEIEKNKNQGSGQNGYRVQVRFDDGGMATYDYGQISGISVGSRVKLVNGSLLTN